jgi:hypothetical protein
LNTFHQQKTAGILRRFLKFSLSLIFYDAIASQGTQAFYDESFV